MPVGDSAQSGVAIPGFLPLQGCDEGYTMSDSEPMLLANEFLFEHLQLPRDLFAIDEGYDCYYGKNYAHAELRADHVFMRPTHATKFVLKTSLRDRSFFSKDLVYGYHGTPPRNISSILSNGLRGSTKGVLGTGLYCTPFPLYAQLYSSSHYHGQPPCQWRARNGRCYFVDTFFLIRFPGSKAVAGAAIEEIEATVGAEYCLHELFATAKLDLENKIIAKVDPRTVQVQALMVKFHEKDPYKEGGEWDQLMKLVQK